MVNRYMGYYYKLRDPPNEGWVPVPECIGYDEHHDEEAEEEDDECGEDVPDVLTHKKSAPHCKKISNFPSGCH